MDRGDCLMPSMYGAGVSMRARWRGPMLSGTHFFGYSCARLRACDGFFAATAARRVIPATFAAGGASSGPSERVNPQLTGRQILEVAPYGYNLYPNPNESTAFPHATGADPVAVCDCPGTGPDPVMEWNGEHRPALRDGAVGVGQRGG